MSPKKHIFVCVQNRPAGHPKGCCQEKQSLHTYQAFVDEFNRRDIWDAYRLTNTSCLGPCAHGASVVVYPEGVFYGHVTPADVSSIIDDHLEGDCPVERLRLHDW